MEHMEPTIGRIDLKPGRERSVVRRHPWLFSGGVAAAEAEPGALVALHAAGGEPVAWGYYNPHSQIRVRLLSWESAPPDEAWWAARLDRAIRLRAPLKAREGLDAYRLVNAESDGLPGLVVDRYGEWLVLQALTLGIELRKEQLAHQLLSLTGARGVLERSDEPVRRLEGLEPVVGPLAGEVPPTEVEIVENGVRFLVDLAEGHKTGFYLDQRDNRARLAAEAAGADLLNCFAYTGGFSIYAALAGARSVTSVDSSRPALELAITNFERNGLDPEAHDFVEGDVFDLLRDQADEGRNYDLIVLDPPKFARRRSEVDAACRGYKDINLHAMRLLRPGGRLYTFSCSGLVDADLFQKVLFGAALDAEIDGQLIQPLAAGEDHPVLLTFPEGAYLKGWVVRRV